uniref:Reverse transcriptase domain-containing protein n=1 Tax=Myripristis murdjan TaxID=586833 RepID=A0A667XYE7_9TELE
MQFFQKLNLPKQKKLITILKNLKHISRLEAMDIQMSFLKNFSLILFHFYVKIKYLGINITKNLDNLYSKNFDELTCQIKLDLNRWSIIPFSVRERVKIIQMNILPRFLFLFKALPIYIVSNTFKQWDSIIMNFIWNGRKPRIKMKYLKLPKEMGGLDLPNLQAYYQAVQVRNVKIWMLESPHIKWREMEVNCGDIPLTALPFSNYKKSYIETLDNRWVVATLKVWREVCHNLKLNEDLIFLKAMGTDPDFPPNKTDRTFSLWASKGFWHAVVKKQ